MPTMSILVKSLNSWPDTLASSPPDTRCSNCCGFGSRVAFAMASKFRYGDSRRCKTRVVQQIDKRCVPVTPGGNQHSVPRHGAIIRQEPAAQRRQRAARFVHQKIGCGKVPVVTVTP